MGMRKSCAFVCLATAMVVGSGLWAAPAVRPPEPTWLVQRFCDSSFFRPYSPNGVPATNIVRGARLKLPLWQLTMDKGTTRRGYAFVAHTTFTAPTDGRYVFRLAPCADNCCAARLCVGGVFPDEQPDGGIELKAGAVPLAALVREKRAKDVDPKARTCASFDLLVKAPGATDFTPAEISYPADASVMSGEYNRFEREFRAEEGVKRYFCYRTFPIDIPEDGWYEFGVREERVSGNIRLCLDDLQVLAVQPRAIDFNDDYFGEPTFDGNRRSFRFDFIPRMTRVRKLTKGRHLLDVYVYPGPWQFDDGAVESRMTNGALRVGYTRLTGRNPRSETGFWLEGRDDMVFEKGETLRLSAGSASPVAREHVFEVTNRYAGGAAFVQRLSVDTTVKTFTYDCAQEGAFEYRVLDAQGRVVDGPWAFVVADPTPRPRVKGTGVVPSAANEVVDEVVCTEGAGGPHLFREGGGASEVVTNAAGLVYRQAGPLGLRVKRVVRLGKLGSKDFRDKNYRLATEDEIKTRQSRGFLQMDWFAYTLKVRHPGWPHVVRCTVPNDRSRLVTCAAFDRKTGAYNAFNLQAGCGPACAPTSYLSFFVWPNTDAIDVMIPNTDGNHASKFDRRGAVVKIELLECPDGHIPELPEAAGGWTEARGFGWQGEQGDLYVHERTMPPLWADGTDWLRPEMDNHAYHSWRDFLVSWDRFGELSAYRGDSLCAGPVFSYGMQVYRAIPDLDYTVFAASHGTGTNAPYAAWTAQTKDGLVAWFANATDCSLVLTAGFDARSARAVNLTDGTSKLFTKELKVELAPFMPAVWRLPGANRLVSLKAEVVGEGEKGAAVLDAGIVGEAPQPVTRFLTAEGKVFDIGKRRAFDVEEAGSDTLSFWVENPGKSSFTTAFVVGSEACALVKDGKTPTTVVKQADRPRPWYVGVPLHCPDKLTRVDLKLDRTKKGSKVGVAVFNSTGLGFHAHE